MGLIVRLAFIFVFLSVGLSFSLGQEFLYKTSLNGSGGGVYKTSAVKAPFYVAVSGEYVYVVDADKNNLVLISGDEVRRTYGNPLIFSSPKAFAFDGENIIVADTGNDKIKMIVGGAIRDIEIKVGERLRGPMGVFASDKRLYVSDTENHRIVVLRVGRDSYEYERQIGSRSSGSDDELRNPSGLFVKDGLLYVADSGNNRIAIFGLNGSFVGSIGMGKGGIFLAAPRGVYVGDYVFVADTGNNRVVAFTLTGEPVGMVDRSSCSGNECKFSNPHSVWVNETLLYVADTWNAQIKVFSINISGRDEGIESMLASFQENISAYEKLREFASRSFGFGERRAFICAEEVRTLYNQKEFSLAANRGSECKNIIENEILVLSNTISSRILSEIQKEEMRIDTLRARGDKALEKDIQDAQRLLSEARGATSATLYDEAIRKIAQASKILDGSEKLDKMDKLDKNNKTGEEAKTSPSANASVIYERLDVLEKRMGEIEKEAKNYSFDVGISGMQLMVLQVRTYLESSQEYLARNTLVELESALDGAQKRLVERKNRTTVAQRKINETDDFIGKVLNESLIFAPDFDEPKAKLSEAKKYVYSEPEKAVLLADEALRLAQQNKRSFDNNLIFGLAIVVVGIIIAASLVAIAYFLFKMYRERRPPSRGIRWFRRE
ncbi:MAG: hypothetical protein QXG33_03520 [Candidatus Anstonellales archaeon]